MDGVNDTGIGLHTTSALVPLRALPGTDELGIRGRSAGVETPRRGSRTMIQEPARAPMPSAGSESSLRTWWHGPGVG